MFKPSSRRKSGPQEINLNLVPILDALVTLVSFLLLTTTFFAIAVIDTPTPLLAPAEEQIEKLKEKPLQLTAYVYADKIMISDWSGSRELHTIINIPDPQKNGEQKYDLEKLHQIIVGIKTRHPTETKLILKPESTVNYESLVSIMDAVRMLEKTDPPLYQKNKQGIDEPVQKLFPEIIFGNILS